MLARSIFIENVAEHEEKSWNSLKLESIQLLGYSDAWKKEEHILFEL
jgi:hypothetical protein